MLVLKGDLDTFGKLLFYLRKTCQLHTCNFKILNSPHKLHHYPDQYKAVIEWFYSVSQTAKTSTHKWVSRPREALGIKPASDLKWLRIASDGQRLGGVFHTKVASWRLDFAVHNPLQELIVHFLLLNSVWKDKSREESNRRLCAALLKRETMSSWHAIYVYTSSLAAFLCLTHSSLYHTPTTQHR